MTQQQAESLIGKLVRLNEDLPSLQYPARRGMVCRVEALRPTAPQLTVSFESRRGPVGVHGPLEAFVTEHEWQLTQLIR
jgi:hypothetical protein